jgi:hypothetical protein
MKMNKSLESKKLEEFFCHKRGGEVSFADGEGIRSRLGLSIRTIWESQSGFVAARPMDGKFVFAVASKRVNDFGVVYVESPTRAIDGELPGRPVVVDLIEDGGMYYYTIIFEKVGQNPRLPERVNWE